MEIEITTTGRRTSEGDGRTAADIEVEQHLVQEAEAEEAPPREID